MTPAFWVLVSYLTGAIPTGYLAGRITRGIDIREHGSGNPGATNTFRVLGARIAAPVMVVDLLKGFVPAALFVRWDGSELWTWALVYGAAAIIGHVFPVYLRFRGGKGVATATGVFLALAPLAVGISIVVWLAVLRISRMVSLASIMGALTLLAVLAIVETRPAVLALGIAMATFVIFAHRANIGRILRGEEYRFGSAASSKAESVRQEEPR
ncbi:MAG TPA: glycerol-3-phosphate 1-O-acyltransferase PlsY [Longimicrobiaceae bacterium]|nr:glycerol-3-phosphate 1-O-acyltransferase PlsY [Longimicrobiaceae bacterium]